MPKGFPKNGVNPGRFKKGESRFSGWNKGLPKEQQPFFGIKHKESTKQKISDARIGKKLAGMFQEGHSAYNKTGESKYEIQKRADKKWRLAHPEKAKEYNRKQNLRKYGLTISDFDVMVEKQNGKCAVCNELPKSKWNKLFVDHDHKTGKTRALLCYRCNIALGMIQDNPDTLGKLIIYLSNFT